MLDAVFAFIDDFIALFIVLEIILITVMVVAERADPLKALIWIFVLLILPFIGFILYLFVGQTFYANHTFKLKGVKDSEIEQVNEIETELIDTDTAMGEDSARFARTIKATGGKGYSTNNGVTLYTDGKGMFDELYSDLRNAKSFIHFEYYIIRDDKLGNELVKILTQKVKEGVEVKLLTDAFGNGKGPHKSIEEFKKAGGEFDTFHRVGTLLLSPKKNNRNHRKIAIIDGDIAYCGGFNIGDEYVGEGPLGYWRDSTVRVRGATCAALETRFAMDWTYASKKDLPRDNKYLPTSIFNNYGDVRIQTVSGGPDVAGNNPVLMQYLELIRSAKDTLWIHTPYLVPNESVSDALKLASASGVDVRIIIPDKPDHPFVYWNNVSSANRLMKDGIRVFMYNRGFVHSKTIVVDGKYCSVGSANLDDRSLVLNFETNLMIYSEDVGAQMDKAFADDLGYCTEYSVEAYSKRGFGAKLKIVISKLFKTMS